MTYQGTVRGGVVIFPPGAQPPEGLEVTVLPQVSQASDTSSPFPLKNGIPIFPRVEGAPPVTVEFVNQLLDEGP
jgi:hypothetical protein